MADSLKDELIAKQEGASAPAASASSVAESGSVTMPAYADPERTKAINAMYDANVNAQKANLQSSYNENLSNYEANRESIAKRYQQQRNMAATDYERQRRNFNEQAMMNGLNTGTGAQAQLAQNAAYQKAQGQINAAEGTDVSTLERNIADLKVRYQDDINTAVAENDYKLAAALLDEYNTAYSRAQQEAQTRAQYGDFSGYASIYGEEAANQMREVWMRQNPGIAYSLGYITADTYFQLTGKYPAGYSTGGSGRRGGSGGGVSGSDNADSNTAEPDITRLGGEVGEVGTNTAQSDNAANALAAQNAMLAGLASMPGSTGQVKPFSIDLKPVYNPNSDSATLGVATNLREFMGYID